MFWRFPIHVGDRVGMLSDQEFSAVVDEFTPFFVIRQDDAGNKVTIPNSLLLQQMFVVYRNPGRRREIDPAEAPYLPPDGARDDDAAQLFRRQGRTARRCPLRRPPAPSRRSFPATRGSRR